jgi:hypothetical protein
VNAPKSIFQKSNLYRAANSGLPSFLVGRGWWWGRELWFQTRPYSHRAKHLGLHDHLGLVPPLILLEKNRVNFGASKKSRIRAEKYPSVVSRAKRDRATQISDHYLRSQPFPLRCKPITSRLIREPFGLDDLLREQESLGDALVGVHVAYFELDREIACAAASRMRASMPMRSQGRCAWRSHKARCYP